MNLRLKQIKDNITSIILTKKSTLELFILKYKLQLTAPATNIRLEQLRLSDEYLTLTIEHCKTIIDLSYFDNVSCIKHKGGSCKNCVISVQNKHALKILNDELKIINKEEI